MRFSGRNALVTGASSTRAGEIAVLRVALVTRAPYEWAQHVRIAKQAGVSHEEIDRIGGDGPVPGLGEEGALLCRVADEITHVELEGAQAF
jgi:alkylhydroperoxidase family enzyme